MKLSDLDLSADIEFTIDNEPGRIRAEGRHITIEMDSYRGLYRALRVASWHLAAPRPLFALGKIVKELEISLTIKVGRRTFNVLGSKGKGASASEDVERDS